MNGAFNSDYYDDISFLRNNLLSADGILLPQPDSIREMECSEFLEFSGTGLMDELDKKGMCLIQLSEPLSSLKFYQLGTSLGVPIPELLNDKAVKHHIEYEVILNLVSEYGSCYDTSFQPFSVDFLTLHTECSLRDVTEQPRYLVLMCCESGLYSAAQTLLIPMKAVYDQLNQKDVELLKQLRYPSDYNLPHLLRDSKYGPVFSFRDFGTSGFEWISTGGDENLSASVINESIYHLLKSMYTTKEVSGISWKRGMILIFDNIKFFHGKRAGLLSETKNTRHLKRLRIKS